MDTRRPTGAWCGNSCGESTTSHSSSATCHGTRRTAICRGRRTETPSFTRAWTNCASGMPTWSATPTSSSSDSYVPDGIEVGQWVCSTTRGVAAFYDIDTPVTLAALTAGTCAYLSEPLVRRFHLYLSFTEVRRSTVSSISSAPGGQGPFTAHSTRRRITLKSYRSNGTWVHGHILRHASAWTRAADAERSAECDGSALRRGRTRISGRRAVALNVARIEHVPAAEHRRFYTAQRFTLNLTRADMIRAGYSPKRASLRSRRVQCADHQRLLEGNRDDLHAGRRDSHRRFRARHTAVPVRHPGTNATGDRTSCATPGAGGAPAAASGRSSSKGTSPRCDSPAAPVCTFRAERPRSQRPAGTDHRAWKSTDTGPSLFTFLRSFAISAGGLPPCPCVRAPMRSSICSSTSPRQSAHLRTHCCPIATTSATN